MSDIRESVFAHGQLPGALELALVGDSVYDLYVRSHLVLKGGRVKDIHKNADAGDYHKATALESLLGYLYLTGRKERLDRFLALCTNMEG